MKPIVHVSWLVALGATLHLLLHQGTISYLPFPVFLSLTITWLEEKPVPYLIALAVVAELLSTVPPSVATTIVFLPLALRALTRPIEADISFSFAAVMAITATSQIGLLVGATSAGLLFQQPLTAIPWLVWLQTSLVCASSSWLVCIIFNRSLSHGVFNHR